MQSNTNNSADLAGLGGQQDSMGNAGMGNAGMGDPGMGGMGGTGGTGTTGMGSGNAGGGDMLDKGVDYAERRTGHEQSHSTTEKISDGLRKGFKKMTGKDVPVKDKDYQ